MIGARPDFMDSPYFVCEVDNWHLLPGAPESVVKEFEEYMRADKELIDKKSWYTEIDDFCTRYWSETFGHTILCFDNTMEDLDHFLDEEEMLQFVTYVNETFGTQLSTEEHVDIRLDYLYKQILEKAVESYDGYTDIFHEEQARKWEEWNKDNSVS